jgi:hypothetical protein
MASSSETGHAKNIANLKLLNEINAGFGIAYNPINKLYLVPNMVTMHDNCKQLQGAVNTQKGIFNPVENARAAAFKEARARARRFRFAAKTCGAGAAFYKDVNTIIAKILGEKMGKPTPTPDDPAGHSTSQTSYDNTVNHFDALATMLGGEPKYAVNEADLTTAAATTLTAELDGLNNSFKEKVVPYNNALISRNKAMYAPETGLCAVGQGSKDYIRQVFGFSSPEFKRVTKIQFKDNL